MGCVRSYSLSIVYDFAILRYHWGQVPLRILISGSCDVYVSAATYSKIKRKGRLDDYNGLKVQFHFAMGSLVCVRGLRPFICGARDYQLRFPAFRRTARG